MGFLMLGIALPVTKSIGDASNTKSKTILKHPSDHICKFDATQNQVRQFSQQVAARALNTQETPDVIVTNCYK
ncbi:unnamed protein product, partial [Adineta ricciae]